MDNNEEQGISIEDAIRIGSKYKSLADRVQEIFEGDKTVGYQLTVLPSKPGFDKGESSCSFAMNLSFIGRLQAIAINLSTLLMVEEAHKADANAMVSALMLCFSLKMRGIGMEECVKIMMAVFDDKDTAIAMTGCIFYDEGIRHCGMALNYNDDGTIQSGAL